MKLEGPETVSITLSHLEPGYYEVVSYVKQEGQMVATDRTSFAIVENTEFIDTKDTSMFGINTHISAGYHRNNIDLLADEVYKLGVKNVRDHYAWNKVSTESGVNEITDTAFITETKRLGIGATMASGFKNPVYMDETAEVPTTDVAISGFADYCAEVINKFNKNGNPLAELEVWNEYWSWDESFNSAGHYAKLFNKVYEKVNPDYPSLDLAIGFKGTGTSILGWDNWVLNSSNIKEHLGVATVHVYGGINLSESNEIRPEVTGTVKSGLDDLRGLLDSNGLQNIEIKLTETGYSSLPIDVNGEAIRHENLGALSSKYCVTEKEAAMYLPRAVLLGLANGAKSVYPYQLVDGSYDLSTHESFFGLLRGDGTVCGLYSPKPQYVSYATLIRALDGTRFNSLEVNGECYTYTFAGNGKTVTAVYSIGNDAVYEYSTDTAVEVTDIMGKKTVVNPIDGKVMLSINGNVQYITK